MGWRVGDRDVMSVNECTVWLWSWRWNPCDVLVKGLCVCTICVFSDICKTDVWECGRVRVRACSFFPGKHVQQTGFSKPLRILPYLKYSKPLAFSCSFPHLLPESIGAPEYQWELLSVMPPPRGSAMNGWLWLPLTGGYTWPMDSLCRPMWISSSSSSVVLR